jgi:4-amino-4-deoxy-L-arabinose transferase-like glycosyltransferase
MSGVERHGTAIAVVLFLIVAVFGVVARPLLPVDETRYLAVAWEMREGGHWLVPRLNGEIYSHKPPLLFWLINLVWSFTGVSETAGRLVGPIFGSASIVATSVLARRLWPDVPGVGGRAALVLAGLLPFTLYAGLTMFDSMLTLATVLGMTVLARPGPRAWLWLGAALAFGAFAKGPVILVHLVPAALAAPLWTGERWGAAALRLVKAVGVGLVLVAVWLVPALITGGEEYSQAVLWTQSAGRVTSSFAHGRAVWFFLPLLPLLLWPWIWSLGLWRGLFGPGIHGDRGLRLCGVWGGATLLLFSLISGKQVHYLIPAMPAAALVVARLLPPAARAPAAGLVPLALGGALVALWLGVGPEDIATQVPADWSLAAVGVLLILLAAAALRLRGPGLALLAPGLVLAVNLAFLVGPLGRMYDSRPIAAAIAPHDGAIAYVGDYEGEFSFAARLRQPVTLLRSDEAEAWLVATPGGVLLARLDKPHLAAPPVAEFDYNAKRLGLWTGASGDESVGGVEADGNGVADGGGAEGGGVEAVEGDAVAADGDQQAHDGPVEGDVLDAPAQ